MAAREAAPAAPEPLSDEDLAILRLESDTVAGHTLKVVILDPPPSGGRPSVEALRARVAERIERTPRLRCKLQLLSRREAAWVDDPAFDVREHVRALPAASPISDDELRVVCTRLMEERLDRSRPLWTIDLLDPLETGGSALVWRLHHSLADGAMSMRLADDLLWDETDVVRPEGRRHERARRLGDLHEALAARRPGRLPGTIRRELLRASHSSPLEGVVGTGRAVAFASPQPGRLKHVVKRLVPRATLNDCVLALVCGGLRSWEQGRGEQPRSLRVKVPVCLHHSAERPESANRDSFFCVSLPLAEPDPVERLRCICEETTLRKGARDAFVLDTLWRDAARLAPPVRHLLDRLTAHPRAFALNVSNVAGPSHRPTLLGASARALHSIADVDQRHGLRVAVISLADELHFGLCADPGIVADLDLIVDGIVAEAAALAGRAGV